MTMMANKTLKARESGMVLVVSLIILVIVTLLAISALRVTTLEERMAGNTRDRHLAFEAAEYALREAQDFLSAPVLPAFTVSGGSSGGWFTGLDTSPTGQSEDNYWMLTHPWSTKSVVAAKTTAVLTNQSQPRYVIEEFPAIPCKSDSLKWPPPQPRNVYRVTARGTGRTTDAEVMLQMWFDRGCTN